MYTMENQCTCSDTKLRGVKVTCIDRVSPCKSPDCEQQNPLQWPANEAIVILCVAMWLQTHALDDQAKPKSMPRSRDILEDICYGTFTRGKYTCARNWGLMRKETVCSKGRIFRSLWYVYAQYLFTGDGKHTNHFSGWWVREEASWSDTVIFDFGFFYPGTCTIYQGLGPYGPWCSYTSGENCVGGTLQLGVLAIDV